MKKTAFAAISILSLAMSAPIYAQVIINFDVPGTTNATSLFGGGSYNLGVNYVGQGAFFDPGHDTWNPVVFDGTTSDGLLSDGSSSPITLTMEGVPGVYAGNNYGSNVTQGTAPALFTPFAIVQGANVGTLTLNNVPDGVYDLYLYGQNGSDNSPGATAFTIGATTLNTSAHGNDVSTFIQDQNYVVFTGISPSSGTISISFTGTAGEGDFNGLQLVAVPEPGTLGLLLIGVALFVIISRRRKSDNLISLSES